MKTDCSLYKGYKIIWKVCFDTRYLVWLLLSFGINIFRNNGQNGHNIWLAGLSTNQNFYTTQYTHYLTKYQFSGHQWRQQKQNCLIFYVRNELLSSNTVFCHTKMRLKYFYHFLSIKSMSAHDLGFYTVQCDLKNSTLLFVRVLTTSNKVFLLWCHSSTS